MPREKNKDNRREGKPPKLKVKIREYRTSDLGQMLELVRELEAELAERFPDVQIKTSVDEYADRFLKPGTKYKTYVAEVKRKVVGYLIGYPSLGAPEVDNMYDILPVSPGWTPPEFYLQITFVSKPYRNRGISKALHKTTIEYAHRQGHREVYACIAKWNLPELSVIRSFDFVKKDLGYRYRMTLKF
jgi:GNAT superfamily N-acetyltransferase